MYIFRSLSIVFILVFSFACGHQIRLDTSRQIYDSVDDIFADIDHDVHNSIRAVTDNAVIEAVTRVNAGQCNENEEAPDCSARHYRDIMSPWYALTATLESIHGVLEIWENFNTHWPENDNPPEWDALICRPLGSSIRTLLSMLETLGVDIPDVWSSLLTYVEPACNIGVVIVESVTEGVE